MAASLWTYGATSAPEPRPHEVTLLPGMTRILESLLDDVSRAERRVWISTYIYRPGKLGNLFADALARAVRRGADVRLLYDALGSHETPAQYFEDMRARGIRARAYRPLSAVLRGLALFPREHSRIVVIDGAGYVGGAAWSDEWLPRKQGGEGWHEICSRVVGPCVADMERAFHMRFHLADDPDGDSFDYWTGSTYPDVEFVTDAPKPPPVLYQRLRERIQKARSRVWIENAYFCPPRGMEQDLFDAAARGVDVRVILPKRTDLPPLQEAAFHRYGSWLAGGIQLFEYAKAVLHAKMALVDDDWATVGTFNMNTTSLRWVSEANVIVHEGGFVAEAARVFERDLLACDVVTEPPRGSLRQRLWRAAVSRYLDSLDFDT